MVSSDKNLKTETKIKPWSVYLKEVVYGGTDGIVTTFAVVAGFAGANASIEASALGTSIVILFGMANLFADAASMGLGNFLSLRADRDVYKNTHTKEMREVEENFDSEVEEGVAILKSKGFSESDARDLTRIMTRNKDYWVHWMMDNEHQMANPTNERPVISMLATFFSFISFGIIPLLPYLVLGARPTTFAVTIGATVLALVLLGITRYIVTRQNIFRAVFESVLLGGVAAIIAYIIGTLVNV